MKKLWIIMLIICMVLTMAGCRSTGEGGAAAGEGITTESGEQAPNDTNETKENHENTENTEPSETTEAPQQDQTAESEQPPAADTAKTFTYVDDPVLRAEAERIYKEKGQNAYVSFCGKNQIKEYVMQIKDREFRLDKISVCLFKGLVKPGDPAPDFSVVNPTKVEPQQGTILQEQMIKTEEELNNFSPTYNVYINSDSREETIAALYALLEVDCVQSAYLGYIYTDEELYS